MNKLIVLAEKKMVRSPINKNIMESILNVAYLLFVLRSVEFGEKQ